jgi:ABC-type molybdate transport system ATPase subunit
MATGEVLRQSLARALARKPRLMLLYEPFSSLDFSRKQKLIETYQSLQRTLNLKSIIVTHAIREAIIMNGAIVELSNGKVVSFEDYPGRTLTVAPYCRLLGKIK